MTGVGSERDIRGEGARPVATPDVSGSSRSRWQGRSAGRAVGRVGLVGLLAAGLLAAGLLAACGHAKTASASGTPTASTSARVIRFHLWESHSGGPVATHPPEDPGEHQGDRRVEAGVGRLGDRPSTALGRDLARSRAEVPDCARACLLQQVHQRAGRLHQGPAGRVLPGCGRTARSRGSTGGSSPT